MQYLKIFLLCFSVYREHIGGIGNKAYVMYRKVMYMKVIETVVYTFDELSDKAKEKAREWYKEDALDYNWYESDYDDFKTIAKLMGIEISEIYFSGFYSQGDGACFEGRFTPIKNSLDKIKEYAPNEEALHNIAAHMQDLPEYLSATIKHSGYYYHEGCTDINVESSMENYEVNSIDAANTKIWLRMFMKWMYKQLENTYDDLNSDSHVDDCIMLNEYTFTESGKRFG